MGQKRECLSRRRPPLALGRSTSISGPSVGQPSGWKRVARFTVVHEGTDISALIRCTVPVPTPSVVAIFLGG
jgi:hypothetical protein